MNEDHLAKQNRIFNAIISWARTSHHVQALIQTGSLARRDNRADEFSDLDIEVITDDLRVLSTDDSWIKKIGEIITVLSLDEGREWATRLAIFEDGIKVDFTLANSTRLNNMSTAGKLDPLYERGYRVIVDKTGVTNGLPAPSYQFPVHFLPSQERFRKRVEEFWFEAFHIPKYLARGELFLVKQRDWTMKELLLEMIEWHAIARNLTPVDILWEQEFMSGPISKHGGSFNEHLVTLMLSMRNAHSKRQPGSTAALAEKLPSSLDLSTHTK